MRGLANFLLLFYCSHDSTFLVLNEHFPRHLRGTYFHAVTNEMQFSAVNKNIVIPFINFNAKLVPIFNRHTG